MEFHLPRQQSNKFHLGYVTWMHLLVLQTAWGSTTGENIHPRFPEEQELTAPPGASGFPLAGLGCLLPGVLQAGWVWG